MKIRTLFPALALTLTTSFAFAQGIPPGAALQNPPKAKKESYAVYQTADLTGAVGFKVVEAKEIKGWLKGLTTEYKDAVKAYNKEKKENKGKATSPKPKKPKAKKLKAGFKEKDKAEAYMAAVKAKWEKAQEKKKAGGKKKG